jgi:hypothetical protein
MKRLMYCALAVLIAVGAAPAAAQEQRGAIEGIVTDASGAILPGATVEVMSGTGIVISAASGANGVYRFPSLAPGEYTVKAALSGFTPKTVERVEVRLGQIKKVDFALAVGNVSETVQVTASSPLIDVTQAERSTHLTARDIAKLPKGRDFSSVVTQAPGANREARLGGLSIDGASAGENRYIIDGAEATDLRMGVQGKELVVDFVDEVQVKSSGYTAEYGGAMGGVVNVVTKSGTNQFRGDLGTYFTNDALQSGSYLDAGGAFVRSRSLRLNPSNATVAEYADYKADTFKQWDPVFTLGGPIVRNSLWFFASYQPQLRTIDRDVTFTSTGAASAFTRKDTQHFSSNNLRFQAGNNVTGRVAFNASGGKRKGLLPNVSGADNPNANYAIDRETPNYTYSGNVDYVVNPKLFLGVRTGYYTSDIHDDGVFQGTRVTFGNTTNIGLPGVPAALQRSTGFTNTPSNTEVTRDERTRWTVSADATYYAAFGGQHTFKGGVQFDRVGNNVLSGETGNLVSIFWDQAQGGNRGAYGYYTVRSNRPYPDRGFITEGNIHSTNVGLYVQDAWTISNRLTVNVGVRTENEKVPSYTTADGVAGTAMEFSFADKLAPRVGFSYDILGDGRWKASGSWGLFYDFFKLELPRGSFGGDKWIQYWYTLDTPDWTAIDPAGCPTDCPGTLFRGPIDFRHPSNAADANTIDPDLDPMRVQKLDFALEHQLTSRVTLGVRYAHNQVDKAIEDVGALDAQQNEIYKIANPGFGTAAEFGVADSDQVLPFPKAVRDYDSVELSVSKHYSDNWSARVSYMWSRLHGNYSGLTQSDENGRTSPNVGRTFDYPLMAFNQTGNPEYGPLGTDRPHQFKAQFAYTAPFGTTVGVNQYVESGVPVTREARFIPGNNFPLQYLGRGSDGRTDVFSQTDLQLQHEFRLNGSQRLTVLLNVLNLFDRDAAVNKFVTQTASGQALTVSEADFYRGIDTESLIQAQHLVLDPRFLMANGFQDPRSLRVGAKWSF